MEACLSGPLVGAASSAEQTQGWSHRLRDDWTTGIVGLYSPVVLASKVSTCATAMSKATRMGSASCAV
jgi:hypothetical protein